MGLLHCTLRRRTRLLAKKGCGEVVGEFQSKETYEQIKHGGIQPRSAGNANYLESKKPMDHGEVFEIGSKRTRVLSLRVLPALYGRLDFRWVTTRHEGWTSNSVKKEPYGEVECGKRA